MKHPTRKELQAFFFNAMLHSGWIGDGEIQPIRGMPRYKGAEFYVGKLSLTDAWCSGRNGFSAGTTIICLDTPVEGNSGAWRWLPLWSMQYMGRYNDEAIPVVKAALRTAYQQSQFVGGRGRAYRNGDLLYHNEPARFSCFSSFAGRERVTDKEGKVVGYHSYQGGVLFD